MKIAIRAELCVKDDLSGSDLEGLLASVSTRVHSAVKQRQLLAEQPEPTGADRMYGVGGPGACLKIWSGLDSGWVEVEVTPS